MGNVTTNSSQDAASQPQKTARHKRGSGRERVLDAYAQVLRQDGAGAATLDEVARRAEISKGGLLHHFGSKEALMEGLLKRMEDANELEVTQIFGNTDHAIADYLRSCLQAEDEYSDSFMAILKLAGTGNEHLDESLRRSFATWQTAIDNVVDDPILARIIQLVGDGLYVNALIGSTSDERDTDMIEWLQNRTTH